MPLSPPPDERPPLRDGEASEPAALARPTKLSWTHIEAALIGALLLLGAVSMVAGWLG